MLIEQEGFEYAPNFMSYHHQSNPMTEFKLLPTELRRLANELRGYASVEGVARALDGLANDIQSQAHDGEVAYLIADNGDDRLRMVSESEFYKWPNERVQFYTAPPRVVDVEVTQSMVTVGINVGNASVAKYLANAEKDNLTDKYTTDRIYMYAALKAALEKT